MSEIQDEIPVKATSKTIITTSTLFQTISFFYYDPSEIYYSYRETKLLDQLLTEISTNMQTFLSNDKFILNGVTIPLMIKFSELQFYKQKHSEPVINFRISINDDFTLIQGINTIELDSDVEMLDYPIFSSWTFPGKVLNIDSPLKFKISDSNVIFTANQSETIGGYEKFTFLFGKKPK